MNQVSFNNYMKSFGQLFYKKFSYGKVFCCSYFNVCMFRVLKHFSVNGYLCVHCVVLVMDFTPNDADRLAYKERTHEVITSSVAVVDYSFDRQAQQWCQCVLQVRVI